MSGREAAAAGEVPGFWVVTDDPRLTEIVGRIVSGTGTLLHALPGLRDVQVDSVEVHPDWLLADLATRGLNPRDLELFKGANPSCELFLVAAEPNAPVPAELARLSVRHWFLRPLDPAELKRVFRAALRSRRAALDRLRHRFVEFPRFDELIGRAPAFRDACDLAERAAQSPSTVVLIEGETGTGKGIFARAIHRASPRASGPFVEVNCASLPGQLLESELFGHERGAFTHAQASKPGLLELADTGSFFLDEVAETDPQVQAKILKFLDSGRFRRVGGLEEREVEVRVLAATQRDLEAEARAARFRSDLFHRLHVVRVRIPPIRERPGDARLLLEHFLRRFAIRQGHGDLVWGEEALAQLDAYLWPGNVREIVNLCERVALLTRARGEVLPDDLRGFLHNPPRARLTREADRLEIELPEGVSFEQIERAVLEGALERSNGNVSAAAASIRMGRGQFRYRMARLGMVSADARPRSRRRSNASAA